MVLDPTRSNTTRLHWRFMSRIFIAASAAAGVLAGPLVAAHGFEKDDLKVRHPWTRATAAGEEFAVGYMEIRNSGREHHRIIGASTPAAERVELHAARREGDSAKTRDVKTFEVPARRRLLLRPGGYHLALVGLRNPLVKGNRVPLTLHFERAGELKVELEVQAADSKKPHH